MEHLESQICRGVTRREAAAVVAAAITGSLGACARPGRPRIALRGQGRTSLAVAASRVDAVSGSPLLIPVRAEGTLPGSLRPALQLSDGREIEAQLVWIGIETGAATVGGWLPAVDRWVVAPVEDGAIPASVGSWHVVAPLPEDAAGQAVRLGDRTVRVNWLAHPSTLRPGSLSPEEVWGPWRRPAGMPMPSSDLLAPEWRSPLRRWRARLVTTGLDSRTPIEGIWPVLGDPAALDALADLVEARWRVGLARLWYADEEACLRLLARLSRTVTIAADVAAPAWPVDQATLDSLLSDLLDPSLAGPSLAARADAWLGSLPQAAAWIADDAAAIDPRSREPLIEIRAAPLTDRPALLWVGGSRGARISEPQALGAGTVGITAADAALGAPAGGAREFVVHCGEASVTLAARALEPLRPPGVRCGPLVHDWTLDAWLRSDPDSGAMPDVERAAVAIVYRDQSGISESGWSLYLECARGPEEGADVVHVWLGPRGAPTSILRITSEGGVRDEVIPGEEVLLGVSSEPDRWAISLPLPRVAVETGDFMRIGISREDSRGVRTAWPRRLMPWEREPSRAALDVAAWSGITPAGGQRLRP